MSRTTTAVVRLGTRASALARSQAELVRAALAARHPDLPCELVTYSTAGDRDLETPLPALGGKGVFTAELEQAITGGAVTAAVHSLKDLPTESATGLIVAAVLERADPADVVVSRSGRALLDLPRAPAIGTSSLRRTAQVLALRPDARILPLRGNVETRVRKLKGEDGPYDAIVLAAAGLMRLRIGAAGTERLSPERFLPAPGQGAIAIECAADEPLLEVLRAVHHEPTGAAVTAEREFLRQLGGGCSAPVGAYARFERGALVIDGVVASVDGTRMVRVHRSGDAARAAELGRALADEALAAGAGPLLGSRA